MTEKRCAHCEIVKSIDNFHVNSRTSTGTPIRWHSYCKQCQYEYAKEKRNARRRKQQKKHAQETRNISLYEFEQKIDIFIARLEGNGYTIIERRKMRKTERYRGGKTYRIFARDPDGNRVMFRTARKGSTWGNREVNPNAVLG